MNSNSIGQKIKDLFRKYSYYMLLGALLLAVVVSIVVAGIVSSNNKTGGKIENGETMKEALVREIREELELDIEVGEKLITTQNLYPEFHLTMHCFLCEAKSKNIKLNVHKDFVWLKRDQLKTLDWAEADVLVVDRILQKN